MPRIEFQDGTRIDFNPNHGPNGQFSSGGGGPKIMTGAAIQSASVEELEGNKKALNAFYQSGNPSNAQMAGAHQQFQEIQSELARRGKIRVYHSRDLNKAASVAVKDVPADLTGNAFLKVKKSPSGAVMITSMRGHRYVLSNKGEVLETNGLPDHRVRNVLQKNMNEQLARVKNP